MTLSYIYIYIYIYVYVHVYYVQYNIIHVDEVPLYPPFTNKTRKLLHQLCNITSSQCHDDKSLMRYDKL